VRIRGDSQQQASKVGYFAGCRSWKRFHRFSRSFEGSGFAHGGRLAKRGIAGYGLRQRVEQCFSHELDLYKHAGMIWKQHRACAHAGPPGSYWLMPILLLLWSSMSSQP